MLAQAVEQEIAEYIDAHRQHVDPAGHRLVVRNGHSRPRKIQTGVGLLEVAPPRVHDRRVDDQGNRFGFVSKILPPYLRRAKNIEELIPWLYLKGISTGDFGEALTALLGPNSPGLSPTNIVRLKEGWEQEWRAWSKRDLTNRYVYVWADGIHFNLRLDPDRPCVLVLMGVTPEGNKELIAVHDGQRESELSWKELLLEVKSRGLKIAPELAVGDGALGFWKALPQVYPATRAQRCWVHKTANVIDKLPQGLQGAAKTAIHRIYLAATRAEANQAFDLFVDTYEPKYPKATECLSKDREALLAFYDFPAQHWPHIRSTNPIESTFATVRLRTVKTKGAGSRTACLTMVFKLLENAQLHWRALNGSALLPEVIQGVRFIDGVKSTDQKAAA
jgi:transposase-like protein